MPARVACIFFMSANLSFSSAASFIYLLTLITILSNCSLTSCIVGESSILDCIVCSLNLRSAANCSWSEAKNFLARVSSMSLTMAIVGNLSICLFVSLNYSRLAHKSTLSFRVSCLFSKSFRMVSTACILYRISLASSEFLWMFWNLWIVKNDCSRLVSICKVGVWEKMNFVSEPSTCLLETRMVESSAAPEYA